jgi:hypothetical protein
MSYNNKTFFDFIEEAYSIVENDENFQVTRAKFRREAQIARQRGDTKKAQEIEIKLAQLQPAAQDAIGSLLSDKKPSDKHTWTSGKPQKSKMRDSRLGPTRAQRDAEHSADKMLGSSVESGATFVDSDGVRRKANFTKEPVNIRSDATRKDRRSGASRTTERPEVGRSGTQTRTAENAPKSFKERG